MTPPFLLLCSTSTCESCVSYMTPFPTPYSTSICGFCVSSRLPPFSAFRRRSYTRFSNSPRNNTAWYSSFVSSPIGALLRCSGYFFGDAILRCFFLFGCHALHKPSPHGLGCSCALAYVSFIFRLLASYSSFSTLALKSLTLSTWC